MAIDRSAWQCDWAVAPGEILQDALEDRNMSQSELARRMGRPIKTINEIVNGKAAITPETAIQLERTLGITATFWNNLEAAYREHLARQRAHEELEANAAWVDAFPIKEMADHGLIERGQNKADTLASLLRFFGMSSPRTWESYWLAPAAAFHASPAFEASPHAIAAWLRWGEREGADIPTEPFNSARLRDVLTEIRGLTRQEPFVQTFARIQTLLASAGVVLVITPEVGKTRLSGAARWLSADKAIIQLSLRHKSNDHFWFSLFHEGRHLLGRKRTDFIDINADADDDSPDERAANQFARDTLIPPEAYAAFVEKGSFSETAVRDFARAIGIAPGLVVGRLQRDNHIPRSHFNNLKKPIKLAPRR